MNQEKIGKFILKLRKEKKMTQQELANKLNVTDRAVSHWENGRSIPDVLLFKPICEIFDISVNELISGEKISKDKLIKKSDENIINTLKESDNHKNKSKKVIVFLIVGIVILLITIFLGILNKYPKIDLFHFTIQQSDSEKPYKLEKQLTIDKRNVYYYGLDFAIFCEKNENCYQVKEALKHNQITLDDFQKYLEKQAEYENFEIMRFRDGGTTVYLKGGMQIMFCNTIDGNKDIYVGNDKMLDDLNGKYCGHTGNKLKTFTRTYYIVSASEDDDENYINLTLKQFQGDLELVKVDKSVDVIVGRNYEFTFSTYIPFEDTIKNIFNNSLLLKVEETDKTGLEQINDPIDVNDDLDDKSELNELEHVRMDIVDGTLTRKGAKIIITDFNKNKYNYGEEYRLDVYKDGEWEELEEYCPTKNCAWNYMAYLPDKDGHLLFTLDWSYLYGELKEGRYRIVKHALKNGEECSEAKCKKYYFSVEFDIE